MRPSWLLDRDDNLTLLDEEVTAALGDETARAVLREVVRLPERERKIVLGIVRQFGETSGVRKTYPASPPPKSWVTT